jgi:hypothetical protein
MSTSKDYSQPSDKLIETQNLFWPSARDLVDHLKIVAFDYVPIASTDVSFTNDKATGPLSDIQDKAQNELATILLPIPPSINYTDSLSWADQPIGAVGKLLPAIAKSAAGGDSNSMGSSIQTLAKQGLSGMIASQLNSMGINADALTQGIAGKVLNPYREQIFGGIGMREFSFQWKLVPRNEAEQLRIHNIIKALRYYSLPNYSGQSAFESTGDEALIDESAFNELSDRWLTVPRIFKLEWKHSGDKDILSLPKIKPCVLKNVAVNFTPDGVWASHYYNETTLQGPVPVAYELSLQFAETEIVTASNVGGNF